MTQNQLNEIIELNRKLINQNELIISQNTRILSLLKGRDGNFNGFMAAIEAVSSPDTNESIIIEDDNPLLEVGEVFFTSDSDNIFKLNADGSVDGDLKDFNKSLALLISGESKKLNKALSSKTLIIGYIEDDNVVKLQNIPQILKSAMDNNFKNVLLPKSAVGDLLYAPQELMTSLNLKFYNSSDDALKRAFKF